MTHLPETQYAVQITGVDAIEINPAKPVHRPGPHQILLEVEASGIGVSHPKLLPAFPTHPRTGAVVGGVAPAVLAGLPSYVPGDLPTVPGHEPVARVVEVGDGVTHYRVGERVLIQADWKHVPTASSNGAFGYNFEGALQQYVLVDERLVVTPDDEFMLRVGEDASAAAIALVEPWATVEGSYAWPERRSATPGGRLLVVADPGRDAAAAAEVASGAGEVVVIGGTLPGADTAAGLDAVVGRRFDDVVYLGSDAATVEALGPLLAQRGILCVVLGGGRLGRDVAIDVGRIHYDFLRYVGTTGDDPAEGYAWIPATGEIRAGDRVLVVGAAGPMGVMHTLRATTLGLAGVSVVAADVNDDRLATLASLVAPKAAERGVDVRFVNSTREQPGDGFGYVVCLVPVPALAAAAVAATSEGAIVNVFAGFPAGTMANLDLQGILERHVFLFGTSGSGNDDMRTVIRKVEAGVIDTTVSLDAVTGMAGFADAIRSVIDRTSGGKIMVYPALPDQGLVRLKDLPDALPHVAVLLRDGLWTKEAEDAFLGAATLGR